MAILELNLNLHTNPLYWQTAVLNSNAGTIDLGEDAEQKHDLGKVAKAVSELQQQDIQIAPPLINEADYSFVPDIENNQIVYSLKNIRGLNSKAANEILEKRPFSSFEDFYERVYKDPSSEVKTGQMVSLIKSGAFSSFGETSEIMQQFILGEIKPKEQLNGQNLSSIQRLGLLKDNKYNELNEYLETRNTVHKQVYKKVSNPKDTLLKVSEEQINTLTKSVSYDIVNGYSDSGELLISRKALDKEHKSFMTPYYEEFNTPEFIKEYNIALFLEEWVQRTKGGGVERWAMDSLTYYPNKHELSHVPAHIYNISDYFEFDENPEPIGVSKWNGREFPQFEINTIAGTVIDKNNTKHTITLLTTTGVVTCKLYGGAYSHYNKEIKVKGKRVESSWFARGTLLLVNGYRRGDQWIVKKAKNQEHSIQRIVSVSKGGELSLQPERYDDRF